jgi:hypothetical protein
MTTPGTYSAGYATDLINQSNNGFIGSFCMDIRQEAPPAYATYQIYELGDAPIGGTNSPGGMGAQKADDLRRLFNLWSSSFNDDQAAAFQAAVWEIENENAGTYNVYSGDFQINESWGGSFTLNAVTYTNWGDYANRALLANLGNVIPNEDVVALVNSDFQDYALTIRGLGGQEIPEPVTLAGIVLGIGGLAGYVRRRRAMA